MDFGETVFKMSNNVAEVWIQARYAALVEAVGETEAIVILAAASFVLASLVLACLLCAVRSCRRPVKIAPPADAPAAGAQAVLDMGEDRLIAINGKPVVGGGGRMGVSLPYSPDLSVVITAHRTLPLGGAAGDAAEYDGMEFGEAQRPYGESEAGGSYRGAHEAAESSWEADRIAELEHRLRSLEATVGRSAQAPPSARPASHGRSLGSAFATPTQAHPVDERYRIPGTPPQQGARGSGQAGLRFEAA